MAEPLTAPPLLQPGDRVAVISPAGPVAARRFEPGLAVLQKRYHVQARSDITATRGYLAGDDDRRAEELQQAIDDPHLKAIIAARGGYGCLRIVDRIDPRKLAEHPKWLVGYSDLTVLHALWTGAGVQSIHGPNVWDLEDAEAAGGLFDVLEHPATVNFRGLKTLCEGEGVGLLAGGNLSMVCAMLGAVHAPSYEGCVLLLEDVHEEPYRVDRLLTQLQRSGVFDRAAAVALGRFHGSAAGEDGATVDQVLAERLSGLACPVVAGLAVGHGGANVPVRLGAAVRVTARSAGGELIGV